MHVASKVSMHAIKPGEKMTFDHAMCTFSPVLALACACGDPACHGVTRGSDWRNCELQRRYAGYFVPYLSRKIARHAR